MVRANILVRDEGKRLDDLKRKGKRTAALSQVAFGLCKHKLARVELGAVGRQEDKPGASEVKQSIERSGYAGRVVDRSIVQHDNVASDNRASDEHIQHHDKEIARRVGDRPQVGHPNRTRVVGCRQLKHKRITRWRRLVVPT